MPENIQEEIEQTGSLFGLKSLFRKAFRCGDIEAFEALLRRIWGASKLDDPRMNGFHTVIDGSMCVY